MNILKPASRHQLKNGNQITIRHAIMSDTPLILEMHKRSSEETLYNRYGHFFEYEMTHFDAWITLPPSKSMVLVAFNEAGDLIGMAQYIIEHDTGVKIAEPGIIVEDRFQGQGLGWLLARELGRTAKINGVEHFHTFINGINDVAMHLVQKSELKYASAWEFGTRELVIDLVPQPVVRPTSNKHIVEQLIDGLREIS